MKQAPNQPHKVIDDIDYGDLNISAYFMVVGRETFNPQWTSPPNGKARRPPAHIHVMDGNGKYAQVTLWINLFSSFGVDEDARVIAGNKFINNFLLGATYEFSSLYARQLTRLE